MTATSPRPTVTLLPKRDGRVKGGHPWLFSNEIVMTSELKLLEAGALVNALTANGEKLGTWMFNPRALICGRKLSGTWDAKVDAAWFVERLHQAKLRRERLIGVPYYRLAHSEGDDLPGLVIDLFGEVAVIMATSAGMERLKAEIIEAVQTVTKASTVIWRLDGNGRVLEGLPVSDTPEITGTAPKGPIALEENGLTFYADVLGGQKTGWFYDQRANRAHVRQLSKGVDVLDVYTHTGGFGLNALAGGASKAVLVDSSAHGLELAGKSAETQKVDDRAEASKADAFEFLEGIGAKNLRFGVVICDPPAFIKSAKTHAEGLKGYEKLARLGASVVKGGGYLVMCSCSHHASVEEFTTACIRGVRRAGRSGRIIRVAGADMDHPQHLMLVENAYLKCLTFQLD